MDPPRPTAQHLRALRKSRHRGTVPPGFEGFWRDTVAELGAIEPHVTLLAGEGAFGCQVIEFVSLGGEKVRAWVKGTASPNASPLVVTSHGYGGQVDVARIARLSRAGMNVVGVDVRGFGLSRDAVGILSNSGYVMTGHEQAETSILRGAVSDFLQAFRAARAFFGEPAKLAFQGFSFAGGLALMAAGALTLASGGGPGEGAPMSPFIGPNVLAVGAPTFGDLPTRLELCQRGSGKELSDHLKRNPAAHERLTQIFSYFDACHFAPTLEIGKGALERIILGVVHELPCSHTDRPEEAEWAHWERAWIRAVCS